MISAVEALKLTTALLTSEQLEAADRLEKAIEAHVLNKMERRGVDFQTEEIDGNVIAEVNQRLKAAGYNPQWKLLAEPHRFNKSLMSYLGWQLSLPPSDTAYCEARQSILQ